MNGEAPSIKPWPVVSTRDHGDFRVFRLRTVRKVNPRNGESFDFSVLDTPNWVNVVAVTPDEHLVMIEQYRHGTNTVELEVPGGVMEPGEAPEATGARELVEETGYEGERVILLGEIFPNPAIMNNTCYSVLVEGCRKTKAVEFDPGEDLITRLVPLSEVAGLIRQGRIRHSLVVVALYYFDLYRRARSGTGLDGQPA